MSTRALTPILARTAACNLFVAFWKIFKWPMWTGKPKGRLMNSAAPRIFPKDQPERDRALDPTRSILVQAPAGSGKTTLLTDRFLALLAEVDEPGKVVA